MPPYSFSTHAFGQTKQEDSSTKMFQLLPLPQLVNSGNPIKMVMVVLFSLMLRRRIHKPMSDVPVPHSSFISNLCLKRAHIPENISLNAKHICIRVGFLFLFFPSLFCLHLWLSVFFPLFSLYQFWTICYYLISYI